MDVNEELKFLLKFKKKKIGEGGGGSGGGGGGGGGGGSIKKLFELRQKKSGFLHTIYDINMKTKAQISCAVIAQLIHSFLRGTLIAAQAP